MLKNLITTGCYLALSTIVLTQNAVGQSLSRLPYPIAPTLRNGEPVCYFRMVDGRTLNLTRICGSETSQDTLDQSEAIEVANPANPSLSRAGFNPANRSANSCVVFDTAGRPCPQQ